MIKAWAYRNPSPPGHQLVTAGSAPLLAVLAGGLGLGGLALLAFPELSPGSAGAAVVGLCTAGFLLAARSVLALVIEPRTLSDGILLLGREELASRLGRDLLKEGRTQVFGWKGTSEPPANSNGGPPAMSLDPVQLKTLVRQESISRIVVLEPDLEAREDLASALLECRLLGVRVEDAVELYQRLHGKIWLEALDPGRLAFADGFRITPSYRFVKRVVDVVCASLLLVLAGPVMALIALAIKLESPGPILFRQERVGQFGKAFTLLKFRSMREDAEKDGPAWASKNDSRVTRIGGF
ncbi:MAG TPA: sugar transferase, partial [Thermoanaerobaculia bacterium]